MSESYKEPLTFERVWAALMEYREQMKENERIREELREQMKETDRIIGKLCNRFGELPEYLLAPNINKKFKDLGLIFEEVTRGKTIEERAGRYFAEIDILLENGNIVVAVEVKSKPLEKDIDKHIERMEVLRQRANKRNDIRKFRGAIASAILSGEVRNYAHKAGFYVIEQTGDTVKISIPEGFIAREW